MNRIITSEVLVSYSQCPRKAYYLLCTNKKGTPNEYISILQHRKSVLQDKYINALQKKNGSVQPYSIINQNKGFDFLVNATLTSNELEAYCCLLRKDKSKSRPGRYLYIPTIFVGTYNISKEHKLELFFISYILGQIQNKLPDAINHYSAAMIVKPDNIFAHNGLAIALAKTGKYDEAVVHFEKVLSINPDFPNVKRNLNIVRARKVAKEAGQ